MNMPLVMGILNVTPDSFSGDGALGDAAINAAWRLVDEGADVVDIGAESTRPNSMPLTAQAELARLMPVLSALDHAPWRGRIKLSVDTRHALTARRALAMGVDILNDVSGLLAPDMVQVVAAASGPVVVMHHLGLPADPHRTLPATDDAVAAVIRWKIAVVTRAAASGIAQDRLLFDPGIGFGKTAQQSLALVLAADRLVATGGRWLFGHSRKSFLSLFTAEPAQNRDELTLAFSAAMVSAGVHAIRVHNVRRHVELLTRLNFRAAH